MVWLPGPPGRGGDRGGGHPARRPADPVDGGGQQQDLARPGRQGHHRSQHPAARSAGGHARRVLRHRPAAPPQTHPAGAAERPYRRALPALRPQQDRRHRRRPPGRPQHHLRRTRRHLAAHRRPHHRILPARGEAGPPARAPAAAAVRCGQRGQRRAGRAERRPLHRAHRLHRSAAGRHARPAALGQDGVGVGHIHLAQHRCAGGLHQPPRLLPPAHRAAPAGDQQPPRAGAPPGRHRHERDDRGRHLRQRQLHPHHGLEHDERHRWLG